MPNKMTTDRRCRGFTLIELMIAVAIVAILASIAVPSYLGSVWKGKRGEAKTAIMRTLQMEERYYTQSNTYIDFSGSAPANTAFSVYSADSAANSRYLISAEFAPSTNAQGTSCSVNDKTRCIRIVATVVGAADPKCGNKLSMDTAGVKQSAIVNAACWN